MLVPLEPLVIRKPEALPDFQVLQANLDVQGANELLNNLHNMLWKHNSQVLDDIILHLRESLHHTSHKGNMWQEVML